MSVEYSDDGRLNHDTTEPSTLATTAEAAAEAGRPSVRPSVPQVASTTIDISLTIQLAGASAAPRPTISNELHPSTRQPAPEFLCRLALSDRKLIPDGQNVTQTTATTPLVRRISTLSGVQDSLLQIFIERQPSVYTVPQ